MRISRITRGSVVIAALLAVFQPIDTVPAQAGEPEQACASNIIPPPPITPDVETGFKASPHDRKVVKTLNEKPPKRMTYLGTSGFLTQRMEAIPNQPTCQLGAAVVLSRPLPNGDRKFNSDCCPPGLKFASSSSVNIVGRPTQPGAYRKTILLCGYCKGSSSPSYRYPIQAAIRWVIKGRKPRRLD